MGQLVEYEKQLLKETTLICTPLSELKLGGLRSTSDDFISNNPDDTDASNVFPSPCSSDDVIPSPASDMTPSPSSDDMQSPSCSEFNNRKSLGFGLNLNSPTNPSRTFTLKLGISRT